MKAISETVNKTWSIVILTIVIVVALVGIGLYMWKRNAAGAWKLLAMLLILGGTYSAGMFTSVLIDNLAK